MSISSPVAIFEQLEALQWKRFHVAMFQQVGCSVRPTHMKNTMNSPVAAQSFAARNDITYSPKIASASKTTDTFEVM